MVSTKSRKVCGVVESGNAPTSQETVAAEDIPAYLTGRVGVPIQEGGSWNASVLLPRPRRPTRQKTSDERTQYH